MYTYPTLQCAALSQIGLTLVVHSSGTLFQISMYKTGIFLYLIIGVMRTERLGMGVVLRGVVGFQLLLEDECENIYICAEVKARVHLVLNSVEVMPHLCERILRLEYRQKLEELRYSNLRLGCGTNEKNSVWVVGKEGCSYPRSSRLVILSFGAFRG